VDPNFSDSQKKGPGMEGKGGKIRGVRNAEGARCEDCPTPALRPPDRTVSLKTTAATKGDISENCGGTLWRYTGGDCADRKV